MPVEQSYAVLKRLPLLRFLPPDVRTVIADSFTPVALPFGSEILREGEPSDGLYVLVSGKARVVKGSQNGEEIALNFLRPGDSFGEMGLLDDSPARATVRATSDVQLLKLDKSLFRAVVQNNPRVRNYFELQTRHRSLQNFFHLYSAFSIFLKKHCKLCSLNWRRFPLSLENS